VEHSHHKVFGCDTNGNLVNLEVTSYERSSIEESGGQCANCHMPQTVYMQRHWRHDHGFTIPDPLLTKRFGIPNACNRCHADKTVEWGLEHVERWYGDKMDRPYRHRAQILAGARQGDDRSLGPLLKLLESEEIPYWRAAAAALLERWAEDPRVTGALTRELKSPHPLVRQMAVRALGRLIPAGRTNLAEALGLRLNDDSRNVRIEAARELAAMLDTNSLAGSDYMRFLDHVADQPVGQLQAGMFELARGDPTNAVPHIQRAVEWDPSSAAMRHELAVVLSQLGRPFEAARQLEEAVRLAPDEGEFHYKLALALNDAGETERVLPELEQAVKLEPRHARAWYNLGLARSGRGDATGALDALVRAESIAASDARIPYARATVLAGLGRIAEAKVAARRALELEPSLAEAAALLDRLVAP
jgi:tetratricopeptide (TPR) repeat protein